MLQTDLRRTVEPRDRDEAGAEREHGRRPSREHHEGAWRAQDGGAGRLRDSERPGERPVNRRDFLRQARRWRLGVRRRRTAWSRRSRPGPDYGSVGRDRRAPASSFSTTTARTAASFCPKRWAPAARFSITTATAGRTSCWSTAWTGRAISAERSTLQLYRNNRNGTFTDVTRSAGPRRRDVRHGRRRWRFQQRRLSRSARDLRRPEPAVSQYRQGHLLDVTQASGLGGRTAFSTSALWFDFDRDGLLDLFVCNYVDGRPSTMCSAASTASRNPIARRRRIAATPAGCFAIAATARSKTSPRRAASSTRSSKSLGVAMLDYRR